MTWPMYTLMLHTHHIIRLPVVVISGCATDWQLLTQTVSTSYNSSTDRRMYLAKAATVIRENVNKVG